jgi:hypothetical protein
MQAICIAAGPRIRAGAEWPEFRIIDIAPMIAELADFPAPPTFRGRSPLAIASKP